MLNLRDLKAREGVGTEETEELEGRRVAQLGGTESGGGFFRGGKRVRGGRVPGGRESWERDWESG